MRWGCSGPNMMNVPKGKWKPDPKNPGEMIELLPNMRDIFKARAGCWLVGADYSQGELRCIALQTGARKLLDWYEEGRDVHSENTKALFQRDDFTPAMRTLTKNFVFNANYLGTAETIHGLLIGDFPQIKLQQVEALMRQWFSTHAEIPRWHRKVLLHAEKHGFVEEPFSGVRHYFYDGRVVPTEAVNMPVQTMMAWLINEALEKIDQGLDWLTEGVFAQIHDELILEGPDPLKLCRLLQDNMQRRLTLGGDECDFTIDYKIGRNLGRMKGADTLEDVERLLDTWND